MNKNETGNCERCGPQETFEHVMLEYGKHRRERLMLKSELQKNRVQLRVKEIFQRDTGGVVYRAIFDILVCF